MPPKRKPARKAGVTKSGKPIVVARPKRVWPLLTIAYVALVLVAATAGWQLQQDQRQLEELQRFDQRRAYDLCVSGNERTQIIEDAIRKTALDGVNAIIAASNRRNQEEPLTPAEQARYNRDIVDYRDDTLRRVNATLKGLGPRDCEKLYPSGERGTDD